MNTNNTNNQKALGPQYLAAACAWTSKKDAPKTQAAKDKKAAERHSVFNADFLTPSATD